jgi:hypothetical protein
LGIDVSRLSTAKMAASVIGIIALVASIVIPMVSGLQPSDAVASTGTISYGASNEIRCLQWFRDVPYSDSRADASLVELKADVPSCNYLHIETYVSVSGNTVTRLTDNSTLDYAVSKARAKGYKIIFRVQYPNAAYAFVPADAAAWFASFTDVVKSYAKYAQSKNIEVFCIAIEFTKLEAPEYASYWETMINTVRSVYSGKLVYETNWWYLISGSEDSLAQKLACSWFSYLDYIAVSAYWEVANHTNPSVSELVYGWNDYRSVKGTGKTWLIKSVPDSLMTLSQNFNKKILLVSGLAAAVGACMTPYGHPDTYTTMSLDEQNNWYEAMFQVFHGKAWVVGFEFDAAWSTSPNKPVTKEYFIQGKPTRIAVENWFSK